MEIKAPILHENFSTKDKVEKHHKGLQYA